MFRRVITVKPSHDRQQLLENERIGVFSIDVVSSPVMDQSDPFVSVNQGNFDTGRYCGVIFEMKYIQLSFKANANMKVQEHEFDWFFKLLSTCWVAKQKNLGLHQVCALDCQSAPYHTTQFDFYIKFTNTFKTDASDVFVSKTHSRPISFVQPWVKTLMLDFGVVRPYVINSFEKTALDPVKSCQDYFLNNRAGFDVMVIDLKVTGTKETQNDREDVEENRSTKKTYAFQYRRDGHLYTITVLLIPASQYTWFGDCIHKSFAQCMALDKAETHFQLLNICGGNWSSNASVTITVAVNVKVEERNSIDNLFELSGLPNGRNRVAFFQDSVKSFMVKRNEARPYTHESFYTGYVTELLIVNSNRARFELIRQIGSVWAFYRFDLEMTWRKTTLPQILAERINGKQPSAEYELHALLQTMVFCGAFTSPNDNNVISTALDTYERAFNLPSTFKCVYSFLYDELLQRLIPPIVQIVLGMLGLYPKT